MAYVIAHVGGVLVEETLLPLVSSPLSRIWKLVLAVGFPLLGLLSSFEKDKQ